MYNGVINVYKEAGYTSHDVVAKLRGITHQKKIGHTGTLDPAATGVLPVCLGAATRICDMLTDDTKEYEAVLLLGVTTDTLDMTGEVQSRSEVNITEDDARSVISGYIGEISQIPPMYSALKVNGKKLYELARAGKEIERKPRKVTISDIKVVDINMPRITMRVTCSKGTYIRTLCDDIGRDLGCGGAMEHLVRTRVGDFEISGALTLDRIREYAETDRLDEILTSPADIFGACPILITNEHGGRMASNGNMLACDDIEQGSLNAISLHNLDKLRVMSEDGFFYGVYSYHSEENVFKPEKMFLCR